MSVYGPMVPVTVVEDLAIHVLRRWLPSYLGEIERVTGREQGSIQEPRSWGLDQGDPTPRPEQQLPAIAVLCGGGDSDPQVDGDDLYSVAWPLAVRLIVTASSPDAANRLVKAYATAVDKCLLDQPMGSPVVAVDWTNRDEFTDLSNNDRLMLGATCRFTAYVENVLQRAGPLEREVQDQRDPSPDLPTVETVGVVGRRLPVND